MTPHELMVDTEAKKLMNIIDFDYETCHELVITFVEQVHKGLVTIEEYIEGDDRESVGRVLHQLKGAAGAIRIDAIRYELEKAELHLKNNDMESCLHIVERIANNALFQ